MSAASQRDRVFAALRTYGSITTHSFSHPPVIDGGDPIENVQARIFELREAGHNIVTSLDTTTKGKRFARYQLHGEAASDVPSPAASPQGPAARISPEPEGASEPTPLFEVPAVTSSHYDSAA